MAENTGIQDSINSGGSSGIVSSSGVNSVFTLPENTLAGSVSLELIFSTLQQMNSKLDRLDPLERVVKELKRDLSDLKTSLEFTQGQLKKETEDLLELKEDTSQLQVETARLKSEISQLRKANLEIEERAINQEAYSRRENALVHGIAETKNGTDNEVCSQIVAQLFVDMNVGPFHLTRVHRLGQRKRATASNPHPRPRPIIIRFSQYSDKGEVMRNSYLLKNRHIFFSDDYPQEIQERRLKLKPVLKLARQVDDNAKLMIDKIVFQNKQYSVGNIQSIPLNLQEIGTEVTDTHVYFKGSYSPLSNLYSCHLNVNDHSFNSSEQLFQFKKASSMGHPEIADQVLATSDPFQAMILGKQVPTDDEWAATTGSHLMEQTLRIKLEQVPEFCKLIQEHRDKAFVEASVNKTWGSGIDLYSTDAMEPSKWIGKNLLGPLIKQLVQ